MLKKRLKEKLALVIVVAMTLSTLGSPAYATETNVDTHPLSATFAEENTSGSGISNAGGATASGITVKAATEPGVTVKAATEPAIENQKAEGVTVQGMADSTFTKSGEWYTYDEIKPAVDDIITNAKTDRYIKWQPLGKSAQGRDIPFVILAKSQTDVDNYLNVTLPKMMDDPASIIADINNGKINNYKPVIWFNSTHSDEYPNTDAEIDILKGLATQDQIKFKTNLNYEGKEKEDVSKETEVSLNVPELLDNYIVVFSLCINPDGRASSDSYEFQRETAAGFDPNRDVAYQTQVEDANVFQALARWSPMIMNDFHGFVAPMLIEPCTPPHDPNFEFDLFMSTMMDHAHAMGQAAISNTSYDEYQIPRLDQPSGWDDAAPMYAAVFGMMQGAMGHTIEIPSASEESTKAFDYIGWGSLYHALQNKEKLYKNQLEIYKRGVEGFDSREVDKFLVNASGTAIGRPRNGNDNFFPEYYVLPVNKELQKNALAAYDMVNYFLKNSIKVEKTTTDVTLDGKTYPAGSYVIPMHQAKRGFVNTVMYDGRDVSDFSSMYAEVTMSFPDLRGFNKYEVRVSNAFEGKTEKITKVDIPSTVVPESEQIVIKDTNNDVIKAVNELLANNKPVRMLYSAGKDFKKGDFVVSKNDIDTIKDKYYLELTAYAGGAELKTLKQPKVMAVGHELIYILKPLGFDLVDSVGSSNVIADTEGNSCEKAVKNAINNGEAYVGVGGDAINTFTYTKLLPGLKVKTSARAYEGVLKTVMDTDSVITSGYDKNERLYYTGKWIESAPTSSAILARVSDKDDFFVEGWWGNHDLAKGKISIMQDKVGAAKVTFFATDIVHKAHPSNEFRMLANAIYDGVAVETPANKIIASEGGIFTENGADVIVPAYAFDKDFTVTVNKLSDTSKLPQPNGNQKILSAFEITKDQAGDFSKAVTVNLKYDKSQFDGTSICWLDETNKKWVPLDNVKVNKEAGSVKGDIAHFAKFALIGTEIPSSHGHHNGNKSDTVNDNKNTNDNTVQAGKPGSISKNGVDISIPANATEKDINITINTLLKTANLPVGKNEKLVSEVYEITKDKSGNFNKPITISLKYNKNSVDMTKDTVSLYWLDEKNNKWVELDNVVVDQKSGLVKGSVNHFTKFAVLSKAKATEDQPAQTTVPTDAVGHWAEKNITAMIKLGAVKGYTDNTFKPNNKVTRAEFATMLVKALKLEGKSEKVFADTEKSWAKSYMSIAAENGIISGYGNNLAGPNDLITREQMAVMIAKAVKLNASSDELVFNDKNQISSWSKEYVSAAVKAKKISGYPDGSFNPKGNATRAEAITMIMNCLSN